MTNTANAREIQAQLRGALQRASRAGDADTANAIREEGRRMIFLLAGLIKASRVYSAENAALLAPSRELATITESLLHTLGTIQFVLVEDQVYMNEIRLRIRPNEQPVVEAFIAELRKHAVGGLSFHSPLDASQSRAVAVLFGSPAEEPNPRICLARKLALIGDIQITGRWRFRLGGDAATFERTLDQIIVDTAGVLSEAVFNVGANRVISTLPIRRAVIELIEKLKKVPLAAAAVPLRFPDLRVGERHLVAAAGICIILGRELGLDDASIADLGIASVLHDVGYVQVPDRLRHAEAGARLLIRQRGFHEAKIRRLMAVLEHHRPVFSPGAEDEAAQTLFARIIHIANDYDILVATRPKQMPPVPPPQALATLWGGRGRSYDPVLVALLAHVLGKYPPGTLLELSDWRWAVVVSGGRSREQFALPLVRLVRDPEGDLLSGTKELDLSQARPHIEIRRVVDPALSGFDVTPALDLAFSS